MHLKPANQNVLFLYKFKILLHFCERKPIPFQVRASLTSNLVFKKIIVVGFSPKSLARLNCTQKQHKGKSSEQSYCLFLYNSEVFLNVPAIRHFVGFTLHSIVKNNSSFEKKKKCDCTPLQKCCKHFGWRWLFFFPLRVDLSQTFWTRKN